MENIEFISAKDLLTTESNEVDVLCVEKGELKRKDGASLGGGGYDVAIRCTFVYDEENGDTITAEVIEGSYEAAKQKIENDIPAYALIIEDGMGREFPYKYVGREGLAICLFETESGENVECLSAWGFDVNFGILPDNTVMTD